MKKTKTMSDAIRPRSRVCEGNFKVHFLLATFAKFVHRPPFLFFGRPVCDRIEAKVRGKDSVDERGEVRTPAFVPSRSGAHSSSSRPFRPDVDLRRVDPILGTDYRCINANPKIPISQVIRLSRFESNANASLDAFPILEGEDDAQGGESTT